MIFSCLVSTIYIYICIFNNFLKIIHVYIEIVTGILICTDSYRYNNLNENDQNIMVFSEILPFLDLDLIKITNSEDN